MVTSFIRNSFLGGMNQEFEATKLKEDEYPLLVNGRSRYGVLETIQKPVQITGGLIGRTRLQGVYAANNLVLVFADGLAFYKNLILDNDFTQISNFAMSPDVDVIYAEAVLASTVNYKRYAASATNVSAGVNLTTTLQASPIAVVCQDGINQPWLILPDGSARVTQNYEQWNTDNREYVPVGKYMLFSADGTLYVTSPDGKSILRSVGGRPLDFMVVVDTNANKLLDPDDGDAYVVAHTVSINELTGLNAIPSDNGSFFVSTVGGSFIVMPRQDASIFGEPRYRNMPLAPTGTQNPFSTVDILGDTALIDLEGIKTFNSVLQLKNEGRNAPFSARINNLFKSIRQSTTACAVNFDDYALFSMDTIYGPGVIVFDTIRQRFTGIDIYEGVGKIRQFAQAKVGQIKRLFFLTEDNELYEAFASDDRETCQAYIGEFVNDASGVEQKVNCVKLTLTDVFENGTIYARLIEDSQLSDTTLPVNIVDAVAQQNIPLTIPVGSGSSDNVRNILFNFKDDISKACWKVGVLVTWNFNAKLSNILVESEQITTDNSVEQNAQTYAGIKAELPVVTLFSPVSGIVGTIVTLLGSGMVGVTAVTVGGVPVTSFSIVSDTQIRVTIPVDAITGTFRLTKQNAFGYSTTAFTVVP